MKVLQIITKSNWGGAQRHVFDVAANLNKNGHEVSVAAGIQHGKAPLISKLKSSGISTYEIYSLSRDIHLFRDIKVVFEIYKLIKNTKPDIVHLHSSKIGLLGAIAARLANSKKIIFTAHGTPFNEDRNILSRISIYFLSYITVLLSHKVICVSKKVLLDYPKLFCLNKMYMVHNGMDEPIYLSKSDARETLGLAKNVLCIGTIAELHPNKGLITLFKSTEEICKKYPNIQFHIIGGGQQEIELRKYIKEHSLEKTIFLHGFIDDAKRYLPAFDIFVLPSINEGLPYVLLEAAHASLPMVASDVGGVSEVIINTETGLLFKSKSTEGLSNALYSLITDTEYAALLGRNAKRFVQAEFSEQKMFDSILDIYKSK